MKLPSASCGHIGGSCYDAVGEHEAREEDGARDPEAATRVTKDDEAHGWIYTGSRIILFKIERRWPTRTIAPE